MDKSVVSLATKHLDTLYNLASKKQPKALRTKPTQNPLLFVSKHTQKNLFLWLFFSDKILYKSYPPWDLIHLKVRWLSMCFISVQKREKLCPFFFKQKYRREPPKKGETNGPSENMGNGNNAIKNYYRIPPSCKTHVFKMFPFTHSSTKRWLVATSDLLLLHSKLRSFIYIWV